MCSLVKSHGFILFQRGEIRLYQALYRKWRPKTFDEVIGQEHITETLKNQVRTGHLSHAYIFIGTRGTGKTTCARILAKAVNCEHPVNGNPCNQCRFCRGIDDGSILDIVELDAASNTGVDNVRELKEEAIFSPAAAKKRVYIIDEVHMLSMQAFNALLKIIEEPPPHLMFILATTELQKVPATVLSRCQRHSFRRIPTERLSAYLQEIAARENLNLDQTAAMQIGRLAEGGVRDALSILDQCSGAGDITVQNVFETMGLAGNRSLVALLQAALQRDSAQALHLFQQIWMDGKEPAGFLNELNGLLRDVLIVKAAGKGASDLISGNFERNDLDAFAEKMTREEILSCNETLQNALVRIKSVRNPRAVAELCVVSLCDNRLGDSVASLRARISRLEETVGAGFVPQTPVSAAENGAGNAADNVSAAAAKPQIESRSEAAGVRTGSGIEMNPVPVPEETGDSPLESMPAPPEKQGVPEDPAAAILQEARLKLPMEIRFAVDDSLRFRVKLQNQTLILEAVQGFLLERIKRQEIRTIFLEAAQKVLGHSVSLQISELQPDRKAVRNLEELKQFPEVHFIT